MTGVQTCALPIFVEFGSAVPETVGVLSLIVEPSAGEDITGGDGGIVSSVPVTVFEARLPLVAASTTAPAGSVMELKPSPSVTWSVYGPVPDMPFIVRPDTVKSEMSSPEIGLLKVRMSIWDGLLVAGGSGEISAIRSDVSSVPASVSEATLPLVAASSTESAGNDIE